MSEAIAKNPVKALLAMDAYKHRFEEVLGSRAPQFMASIVNAAQAPELRDANPQSVLAAAFVAATLDLPIDRNFGFAWIIPYNRRQEIQGQWVTEKLAQFQLGYKGVVQLALRTGQYERMNARAINEEAFEGFDDIGEPLINWATVDETKDPIGWAVVWRLKSGFTKVAFWSRDKVLAHAERYSQSYRQDMEGDQKRSKWSTDLDAMARKTVLMNELRRWGIFSVEMQRAYEHDQAAQYDIDAEPVYPDNLESEEMGTVVEERKSPQRKKKGEPSEPVEPTKAQSGEPPDPDKARVHIQELIEGMAHSGFVGNIFDIVFEESGFRKVKEIPDEKLGTVEARLEAELKSRR